MNGAVVKFDALPDADRTGAEYDDGTLPLRLYFVFCAVGGVVIWRMRFKFSSAGIYHLEVRMHVGFSLEVFHFFGSNFAEMRNRFIRHLDSLGSLQGFYRQSFLHETAFHHNDVLDLVDEEEVDSCNAVDFFRFDASSECFSDNKDSFIVNASQEAADIIEGLSVKLVEVQVAASDFEGTECFKKSTFQCTVERHDFAGCLHLRSDFAVGKRELFKRPSREFAYDIVDRRFKACFCISCNGIGDFIKMHAKGNLCCYFGNRIAGCFRCQSR